MGRPWFQGILNRVSHGVEDEEWNTYRSKLFYGLRQLTSSHGKQVLTNYKAQHAEKAVHGIQSPFNDLL